MKSTRTRSTRESEASTRESTIPKLCEKLSWKIVTQYESRKAVLNDFQDESFFIFYERSFSAMTNDVA